MKRLSILVLALVLGGCSQIQSILPGGSNNDTVLKGIAVTELALTGAVDVDAGLVANKQITVATATDIEQKLLLARTYLLKARGYMTAVSPDATSAQAALDQANGILATVSTQEKAAPLLVPAGGAK